MAKQNAINNTAGVFSSDTTITAGTGITATTGNITATAGNVVITAGNLTLPNTTATPTGQIQLGGVRFISNYGTQNTFVGQVSGNTTLTPGSAQFNSALGTSSLVSLTTGTQNTAIGVQAGVALTTGSYNTLLGVNAGSPYTTSESSNIQIGVATGVVSESNVLRIGSGTGTSPSQINTAYISGIYNKSVGATAGMVVIDNTDLIGTTSYVTTTSFTPVLAFGGASVGITYATQTGYYTRIGNTVTVTILITLSSRGSSAGNATITGLPGGSDILSGNSPLTFYQISNFTALTAATGCITNGSIITLVQINGSTVSNITNTNFSNTSSFSISGTYIHS